MNKKTLTLLILCLYLCVPVFASQLSEVQSFNEQLKSAISKYKQGEPQSCLSEMEALAKQDPDNAYVNYYIAISCVKLENLARAKAAYHKVIKLNTHPTLVAYSKKGLAQLLESEQQEPKGNLFKQISKKLQKAPPEKAQNKATPAKVTEPKEVSDQKPSDKEIANAIKVLKRAGLLNMTINNSPYASMNGMGAMGGMGGMGGSPELTQLNLLFGGQSKSKGMDMLPYLMMQKDQNGKQKNISPEIMQIMMNNMMMEGMSSLSTSDKK